MKILRWSAMALAAALGCSIGCGPSACDGTNINDNTSTSTPISCGPGTQAVNGVCVVPQSVHSK